MTPRQLNTLSEEYVRYQEDMNAGADGNGSSRSQPKEVYIDQIW